MGRMLMILVVGMGLVASYSAIQFNRSNLNANDNAVEDYEINQARNLARSGVEYAISRLAQDTTWEDGYTNSSVSNGTLEVSVERTRAMYPGGPDANLNNARLVTAVGTIMNESFTVRAIVEIPSDYVRPPGLAYGIISEENMDLSGNVNITDYNNPNLNSNIHTNHDLVYKGSSSVSGYGTFSGTCPSGTGGASGTFTPNVNNGGALVYQAPPVAIPEIDPTKWEAMATVKYYSSRTINGHMNLGTKEHPEIIYVRGDLHLNGQMTGYGVFLVTGDLTINGGATVTAIDPGGNNLGILVGGDAKINGNSDINATLLIKGDAKINGTTSIIGSIISEGTINFGGTADIYYNPLNNAVAQKVWTAEPGRPKIVSYYE
ncbi:MAG: hypothetical protein IH600_06035 [Bacteroidetes bacterium]|nr:hypothetical protein [Bacteroidota bacterium]